MRYLHGGPVLVGGPGKYFKIERSGGTDHFGDPYLRDRPSGASEKVLIAEHGVTMHKCIMLLSARDLFPIPGG